MMNAIEVAAGDRQVAQGFAPPVSASTIILVQQFRGSIAPGEYRRRRS
jgi:hypothetical protein